MIKGCAGRSADIFLPCRIVLIQFRNVHSGQRRVRRHPSQGHAPLRSEYNRRQGALFTRRTNRRGMGSFPGLGSLCLAKTLFIFFAFSGLGRGCDANRDEKRGEKLLTCTLSTRDERGLRRGAVSCLFAVSF
jgi:hypothetical protein